MFEEYNVIGEIQTNICGKYIHYMAKVLVDGKEMIVYYQDIKE